MTVGAASNALHGVLEDIMKAHAKEETSLDNIVDQEMSVSSDYRVISSCLCCLYHVRYTISEVTV